ncbi:MAG: cystathionine beta-synthase [Parcubacteria group bacterium RIFCSPLOWO2_01_FULL_48_18]|nr:MAG: cystathionine beta-synthase [Parcubacteria group bacterium RIFCSPHIGHO2_02_FULL_48_10b]OHB22638.1 MAG: cystathionine beta-synthase [Parcubacteria group bacterium RIFCSPLOWO2_01_FULL_48_18]
MKYHSNILETIGNTPLVKLNKIAQEVKPLILAKVESFNPAGGVKDRIAAAMILDAEAEGWLKPGGVIVEPTSGNTGLGLALVAALRGYRLVCVMPDKVSMEKELLLRAYGAEVVRTPTNVAPDDPRSYYKVSERIVKETPNSFSPNQYSNQKNPQAHYETTGPEIWRDTNGKVTHFVAGIGTGGTITGASRYLKTKNSAIRVIGADPEGSIYHHVFRHEKPQAHQYKTEGIGEDFIPGTIDLRLIDDIVMVNDKDAYLTARRLVKEEGILTGSSAGTAVFVALEISKDLSEEDIVVVLLPDTGRNYLSTLFDDNWMKKNNLL